MLEGDSITGKFRLRRRRGFMILSMMAATSANNTPTGFALDALTLAWSTAATDNTPGFSVSGDSLDVAPVDAQIELQVADDVNFTPPPSDTELSAITGNPVTIDVSPALSDGQYWARARLLDSGDTPLTDWSNVVTKTISSVTPRQFAANGIYIISANTRQYAANGNYIVEIAA